MSLSKIGSNEIPLDSPWIRLEGARRTRDGPVGKLKGLVQIRVYKELILDQSLIACNFVNIWS